MVGGLIYYINYHVKVNKIIVRLSLAWLYSDRPVLNDPEQVNLNQINIDIT